LASLFAIFNVGDSVTRIFSPSRFEVGVASDQCALSTGLRMASLVACGTLVKKVAVTVPVWESSPKMSIHLDVSLVWSNGIRTCKWSVSTGDIGMLDGQQFDAVRVATLGDVASNFQIRLGKLDDHD
jgi:hypothetical protein